MQSRHVLPQWKWAVVGSGAIGCYYGAKLAYRGRDVHFLMRSDYEVARKKGISVRSKEGNFLVANAQVHRATEEIGPSDVVIIAIKATANEALLDLLPPLIGPTTMLVTLQNGLGNDDFLAQHFGAERVIGGLCFVCLNRVAPAVVEHYGHGAISLGEYRRYPLPRTHDIATEWKRCGVNARVVENLERERWRKLVWNIPFNGLAVAEGGITTDRILAEPELLGQTRELMAETVAIANARGADLPATEIDAQIERTRSMGAYKPSTLVDFLAGRPLEIHAIWGEPLRIARELGVNTPRLAALHQALQLAAPASAAHG
jgi:2-dehydropantoate 2-reductase